MCRSECLKAIRKLEKLSNQRPDPSDVLINIAESVRNRELDDTSWANFYCYITCDDRDEWEYRPKSELPTLGDLTEEQLCNIERDLQKQLDTSNMVCKTFQNGMETFVDVKYLSPNNINNNAQCLVDSREEFQEEKSGNELERVPEESILNLQEDEKRPF